VATPAAAAAQSSKVRSRVFQRQLVEPGFDSIQVTRIQSMRNEIDEMLHGALQSVTTELDRVWWGVRCV
jgi:hypothetical protein